nr:hypothetical protein Iba_chr10fCG8350 [Ipomoea batatas]
MKEGKKTPEMWKEKRIKETDEKGEFWPFLLQTAPARTSAHCTFVSIFSSHVPHAHAPQQVCSIFRKERFFFLGVSITQFIVIITPLVARKELMESEIVI